MKDLPRILVVIKTLGVGGAERILAQAAPLWAASRNFSYRVCHLSAPSDLAATIEAAGVRVTCAGFSGSWPSPGGFQRLREEMDQADLVHAHLPLAGVFVRWARPHSVKIPVVYTEHTLRRCYHPVTRFFHGRALPGYAATIAVGRAVEDELSREGRCRHLVRIENAAGISPARGAPPAAPPLPPWPIPEDAPVILFLGRLEPDKDPLRAIGIFARLADHAPRAHFVLAGEGRLREACGRKIEKLALAGRTHLLGLRGDVPALLARAALVLNTSRVEGHPLSLLEAQAAGRPVVAPALGGIPEIVRSGENGLLYQPKDDHACAKAVLELLGDDALRERLGRAAAQEAAARPTPLQWVEAHERLYAELLAAKGREPAA